MDGICKECGCTQEDACTIETTLPSGAVATRQCQWITPDLCSGCRPSMNDVRIAGPKVDHRPHRLYNKYTVTHKDGRPVDAAKRYFVLSPDDDEAAMAGLRAYIIASMGAQPRLALDLVEEYNVFLPGFLLSMARNRIASSLSMLTIDLTGHQQYQRTRDLIRELLYAHDSLLVAYLGGMGERLEIADERDRLAKRVVELEAAILTVVPGGADAEG